MSQLWATSGMEEGDETGMADGRFSELHVSDLNAFALRDMVECGRALRRVAEGAATMEAAAREMMQFLHQNLVDRVTGERNCALVRCFKSHAFGGLPADLAEAAGAMMQGAASTEAQAAGAEVQCLTLLATAGEEPEWNDRRASKGHRAIPLVSAEMVREAPMIAALFRQMGMGVETALRPDPGFILDADQRVFNVFHVEHAEGDATIPGQEHFVRPYGIKSVLGLGGVLPTGDLFTVILFSRVHIPRETASLFRTIALGVKLALLPHTRRVIFETAEGEGLALQAERAGARPARQAPYGATEEEELRSETATLRLLIAALEDAALEQTGRLQTAYDDLKVEGEKVQREGGRLAAMLEATTDAVFLVDGQWRFTFLNGHAKALIAQGMELLGRELWEVFPEAEGRSFGTEYRRVLAEQVAVKFQEYYPSPLDKWFEVHAFPSDGGVAVFFHDVTDRMKSETSLRQTEKLAAMGKLAASIAHEINNPLEAVTNLLYLLAQDKSLGAAARTYVGLAEEELQRVSEITTQMLRFYRQSTVPGDVDLVEVLGSVLVLFKGRAAQAHVKIERRFSGPAMLRGYAGELRQIFANLVGNAIDAARRGGHLEVRVRRVSRPRMGLRVTVADTGTGMSAATAAEIFKPFFTTKGLTGTGLGLWISLELIEKHRGTVRFRSAEGAVRHGTVFQVFFPVEDSFAVGEACDE